MNHLLISLFFLSSCSVQSQSNTFEWGEGLTYYNGTFDTDKYSLADIETIYNYLYNTYSNIFNMGNIWKIEQMETANMASTDAIYQNAMEVMKTMKLPEGAYWDSLLSYRLREWHEVYEVKQMYVKAMTNPTALKKHLQPDCAATVAALNGTDADILEAWSKLNEVQKTKNCCPDKVEQQFQTKLNSPERMKHARLELLRYDWWNCMNQYIYHHEDENIQTEFEKLFLDVEIIEEDHSDHDHH